MATLFKKFTDEKLRSGANITLLDFELSNASRAGASPALASSLRDLAGLSASEFAHLLGTTSVRFARIPKERRLHSAMSERLFLFRNIVAHALEIFDGNADLVRRWLRAPINELAGQSPLLMMDTVTGFRLVEDVLGRMDYGLPA